LEFRFLYVLVNGLTAQNYLVSIQEVALKLMGKDSLQRVAAVTISDLAYGVSNSVVEVSRAEESKSGLDTLVGGQYDISMTTFSDGGGANHGVTNQSNETINMDTEFTKDIKV
jgi:hypothetical protein